ncbi:MAG: RNA-binding transcriptional accessory protein [Desulfotalea sp.]
MGQFSYTISRELNIRTEQISAVAELLEEGNTVPFISRYRKEATGSLTDEQVTIIRDRLSQLAELEKRKKSILSSLSENGHLDKTLSDKVGAAANLIILEDLYLPYRPKRNTRAEKAKNKGLTALAENILHPNKGAITPENFINEEVNSTEDALAGARDIIAEWINENSTVRGKLRHLFQTKSTIVSSVIKTKIDEASKYRDYFDHQELVTKLSGHRLLAMLRGENEKFLRLKIQPDPITASKILEDFFLKGTSEARVQVKLAIEDSYKRLLLPSLENEFRTELKQKADAEAIAIFASNLRELLLSPALGQKRTIALDPGFRTGAKLVCLGAQGQLLEHGVIYPTHGTKQQEEAKKVLQKICQKHKIEAICIGNGTAGRETELFVKDLEILGSPLITMVNESGASIYSASATARKEFPDHDVTVRGAISIGRRLQDPLAELVKIDPKAIGVGQYQHDVNQAELKKSLEDVVVSCVNHVGVELNTASSELLSFVSGLGPAIALNIINYRTENGPFTSRQQLLKVPRLGAKAFKQCAGFLRIKDAKNPLDNTGVHPERYALIKSITSNNKVDIKGLIELKELRENIDLKIYVDETTGLPTLKDIMQELAKPGRDPRENFSNFSFAENVSSMKDLIPEMILPGIVTNITKFGAFVDIGVHQDGLVHISQMANRYITDPAEIVSIQQQVQVKVIEVDEKRKRIALSMKDIN